MCQAQDISERIKETLDSIRHHLQKDGGDVEFVRYEEQNKVAVVKFLGACRNCPMSIMTLRAGIERSLLAKIPEIKRIEQE